MPVTIEDAISEAVVVVIMPALRCLSFRNISSNVSKARSLTNDKACVIVMPEVIVINSSGLYIWTSRGPN